MNTLRAGKLQFSISDDAKEIAWSAEDLPLRQSASADFWRAYMDDYYRREMRVRSCLQTYGHVEVIDADHIIPRLDFTLPIGYRTELCRCGVPFGLLNRPAADHDIPALELRSSAARCVG